LSRDFLKNSVAHGLDGFHDKAGQIKEEFGPFENSQRCPQFLGLGGVFKYGKKYLVRFLCTIYIKKGGRRKKFEKN